MTHKLTPHDLSARYTKWAACCSGRPQADTEHKVIGQAGSVLLYVLWFDRWFGLQVEELTAQIDSIELRLSTGPSICELLSQLQQQQHTLQQLQQQQADRHAAASHHKAQLTEWEQQLKDLTHKQQQQLNNDIAASKRALLSLQKQENGLMIALGELQDQMQQLRDKWHHLEAPHQVWVVSSFA